MKGTEKQIEFAVSLIDCLKSEITKEIESAKIRSDKGSMPVSFGETYMSVGADFLSKIDTFNDASMIINSVKNNIPTMVKSFCQIANQKYEETK